ELWKLIDLLVRKDFRQANIVVSSSCLDIYKLFTIVSIILLAITIKFDIIYLSTITIVLIVFIKRDCKNGGVRKWGKSID
ncbi:MAG: hypothetical protein WCP55_18950, partial [Lentisphaerota bacterium]